MWKRAVWQVVFLIASSQLLVAQTPSSVSLFSSPNPATYGAAVTITATVTPPVATGKVTFYDGAEVLGTSAISGGQALFSTHLLSTGARRLRAHYAGDSTYSPSDATIVDQAVNSVAAASLQPMTSSPSAVGPVAVVTGDLSGNGKTDVVTCDYQGPVAVFLGNGDGTFQPPAFYGYCTEGVAVGDLNGDGIPDLVVTSSSAISIWAGKGDGTFSERATYSVSQAGSVALADFNGDGKVDLLISTGSNLQVWLGNGDCTLTSLPAQTLSGNGSPVFALGDFNGDGKTDIAVQNTYSTTLMVLLGNGDGTFQQGASYPSAANISMIAAADLRNAGRLDLVLATSENFVSVMLGNGDGTFQSALNYGGGARCAAVAIADFNGDGKPDIAVANEFSHNISILLGNGDGIFQPAVYYAAGTWPYSLATGDFNGDGRVDLAAANADDDYVSIFLGQAAAAPTLQALSVNPSSGVGVTQSFVFQFSDTAGAMDIATISVMFGNLNGTLPNGCVVTYTRSTNSFSLLYDGATSAPAGGGPGILGNGRCNLDPSQSGAGTRSGNNQEFNVTIGFESAEFPGTTAIAAAAFSVGGATTGWQPLGTWSVPSNVSAPTVNSVAPASGTGFSQPFVFSYTDLNSDGDLDFVQAAIGTSTNPASSCVILEQPNTNRIWLATDAGTGWIGPGVLGSQGVLQNSQCTLSLSSSFAQWSFPNLTLSLSLSFSNGYSGAKNIYGDAASLTGADSGWQTLGTWSIATGPPAYLISTIAGVWLPSTTIAATADVIGITTGVATDLSGNVYFSSSTLNAVYRLDLSGTLTRVAGTGVAGFSGDDGPAVGAQLYGPTGIAVDASANLYIVDAGNTVVRKVSSAGTITTVLVNCAEDLYPPKQLGGVAVDASGNLFVTELYPGRVCKVDTLGNITTLGGSGVSGYFGDNGPATSAQLSVPSGVAVDTSGDLFVADSGNNRVRMIAPDGTISTVAGNGSAFDSGDDSLATGASVDSPQSVAVDAMGTLYIGGLTRVRAVTNGIISTVAGSWNQGYAGDGGPAISASLNFISELALDPWGNLYLADSFNYRIRKVAGGIIDTVAGGASGDGVAAFSMFLQPAGIAKDSVGNVYVCDPTTSRVHKIAPSGLMTTVAGTGGRGYSGDNGPATAAKLNQPYGVAVDSSGNLYIADTSNSRIRKVSLNGVITTVAGIGYGTCCGDGGLATISGLNLPFGVAVDTAGNLFIADTYNQRVRKVNRSGIISTVAGNGAASYWGDQGPATAAALNSPWQIAPDAFGNLYIADVGNNRIRKVDANGIITTFAGNGSWGFSGDGGPATAAALFSPYDVSVDSAGVVYITDSGNERIRTVNGTGIISTIAGSGFLNDPSDDGPALAAALGSPVAAVVDTAGNIYVSEFVGRAIRLLTPEGGPPLLAVSITHNGGFPLGGTGQYTLTVANAPLAGPTNGTVTVTEFAPEGLSVSSMYGTGWTCGADSCTRADAPGGNLTYPPITVAVNVSSTAASQVSNQAAVGGGGAYGVLGGQDLTILTAPPTTIQTNPVGLQFAVDWQGSQTAPQILNLSPGPHLISAPSPQPGPPGSQYAFANWSDSGAQNHSVDVTGTAATYTARFVTQYALTSTVLPAAAGSVSPSTGAFFDSGSNVSVTAQGVAPYTFSHWSGAASGTSNPITINMNAAQSVTANFVSCDFNNDGHVDVGDLQRIINEVLGVYQPAHDLNNDGVVNVVDIQKTMNAAMGRLY